MAGVWKKKQWKCKSQNPADRFAWGPNDRLNIYWRPKYFYRPGPNPKIYWIGAIPKIPHGKLGILVSNLLEF